MCTNNLLSPHKNVLCTRELGVKMAVVIYLWEDFLSTFGYFIFAPDYFSVMHKKGESTLNTILPSQMDLYGRTLLYLWDFVSISRLNKQFLSVYITFSV